MKAAIAVSRVSEPNLIQSSLVSRMQKEVSDLENKLKNEVINMLIISRNHCTVIELDLSFLFVNREKQKTI